ncbi:TAXI family TRAP transporter solute-binding subunit [Oleispirillum naphthae]|uniref:TAXI family TRAP transporter solute-binding subunit n=1 Tax=Oleispirillum naphthae TaxID=2838853 RepID=UPI0030822F12
MSWQSVFKSLAAAAILVPSFAGGALAEDAFLKIGTASMGGNFFPMGAAMAEVLGPQIKGYSFTPMATAGSAYNMTALQKGEQDIGLCQGSAVAAAVKGTGEFAGRKTDKVYAIAQYHSTPQHIVYNAKLSVKSLKDLKGKRIELMSPGDGIEVATKQILSAVGLSMKDVVGEHSGNRQQSSSRLKTGRMDAIIDGTGVGAAWMVDVIGEGRFKLLSLSPAEIEAIVTKNSEFSPATIPAKSYVGQDADVRTVANWTIVVVRAGLPDDLVYAMTKAMFENQADLAKRHTYFKDLRPENVKGGIAAPMHPGALRYYKEKGIL